MMLMALSMGVPSVVVAQDSDSTSLSDQTLNEVVVTHRQTVRTMGGAINGKSMMKQELFKAACCNLGESFVNNAAVDVNYTDATTGA